MAKGSPAPPRGRGVALEAGPRGRLERGPRERVLEEILLRTVVEHVADFEVGPEWASHAHTRACVDTDLRGQFGRAIRVSRHRRGELDLNETFEPVSPAVEPREEAGRGGERMRLPTQAGVDRQSALGAQVWIRLRGTRIEIQFREGGWAEGDSSAGSHLEGFDSGTGEGSRGGAQARTESGHGPDEVEPQCRIHGERSPQERSVVGDPQREDLAAVDPGVASCQPFAARG